MAISIAKNMKQQLIVGQSPKMLSDKIVFMMAADTFSFTKDTMAAAILQLGGQIQEITRNMKYSIKDP